MKRRARFNLLLLDESEVYFDEYIATLAELSEPKSAGGGSGKREDRSKAKASPGQTGRLLVCSRGIFFEPDDFKTPLYKFPYRYMPVAPAADVDSPSTFVFQSTQALRMKKGGSVAPYIVQTLGTGVQASPARPASSSTSPVQPPTFAITLQHSDTTPVLTLTHRLWSIAAEAKAGNRSREQDFLKPLIYSRHMGSFDLSLLLDYRERPLSGTLLVEKIRPLTCCPCRLVLTNEALYLQPVPLNNIGETVSKIRIRTITDSVRRRRLLREIGLEVSFNDGSGVFLAFETQTERDATYNQLQELIAFHADKVEKQESGVVRQNSSGKDVGGTASASGDDARGSENWRLQKLRAMTQLWQEHGVSNYEYLMFLNSAADRTCYDLTQYPVFPWVIADYKSTSLDLDSPATFRDLSKPIGALNPARLEIFLSRYREMPKGSGLDAPFMYGTHYSAPGYVLFYLLRKMPEHMLRLQSGKFDAPDRMFNSVAETWTGVNTNPADLKELIPEFYHGDGDFLRNSAGLELGLRADGRPVGDVELPPWAASASDFVSKCRKALECDYVSKRIHLWIDLVFGYRQRGKAAEEAFNVFHPVTYEGVADTERESDPMKRAALVMQISEFGQTPRQIFKSPHPVRTGPVIAAAMPAILPVVNEPDDADNSDNEGDKPTLQRESSRFSSGGDAYEETPTELATKFVFGSDETTVANDSVTEPVTLPSELQTSVMYDSILSGWSPASLVENPEYLRQARVAKDAITVAVLSARPDKQLLYIGSRDGNLLVYNYDKLEVVCEVKVAIESEPERPVAITAIMLPKSEQFAVIGTFNGYLRVFDLSQRRIVQSVAAHDGSLLCATLSKSNHTILSGSGNGEVKVWQLSEDQYASDGNAVTDTPLRTITEHSAAVTALAVDAAAEVCYVGFADARLLVFDLLVGACIAVKRDFEPECVKGDVFSGGVSGVSCGVTVTVRYNSNDCPAAVIGLADGRIAVVTVEGQVLGVLYSGEVLRCVAYDAATNTVMTSGLSGLVKFWDFTLVTAALGVTSSSGGYVMDETSLRVKGLSRFLRTVVLGCARQAKECFIGSFADDTTNTDGYSVLPAKGIADMDASEADLMFGGHLQAIATSLTVVFGCGPDGQFTAVGLLCGYRGGGVRLWTR